MTITSYVNLIKVIKQNSWYSLFYISKNYKEKIMKNYYSALNHLNQNQPEEAKVCFQEIANENPDLFYVKEAKKYLEELAS